MCGIFTKPLGPRQTGKTTMLRSLAAKENKDHEYVSLDDIATCDAVLCMTDKLAAFDRNNLIVPIWAI